VDRPPLPLAPADALGPTGPRFGAYAGSLGRVDLSALAPPGLIAQARFGARVKRWHRVVLSSASHVVAAGVLDAGTLASATIFVVDRSSGEVLFDRTATGVSGLNARIGERPGAGARTGFTGPGLTLTLERRSDRYQLEADLGGSLTLSARLDARGAPEPFALVAPLPEAGVRAAQLAGPLEVEGSLSVRGRTYSLAGALATVDFGSGLFPRQVAWRKLTAAGRLADGSPLAVHLAEGLAGPAPGDGGEDVLLKGPGPTRLPPVVFAANPESPTSAWRLQSLDGGLDLTFRPLATHREARALLLLSMRVVDLAGEVSGHVPGPDATSLELDRVPALVEDFEATW
jgi:Protein of unknown function (DUF2804)